MKPFVVNIHIVRGLLCSVELLIIPGQFFPTLGGVRGGCNNAVMTKMELEFRVKAYLSWAIATVLIANLDEDVCVAELYPGDGQYDCLALINRDPNSIVQINRNGESVLANDVAMSGVFSRAAVDPYKAGMYILSRSEFPVKLDVPQERVATLQAMTNIANWLNLNIGKNSEAICAWFDGSYGAGPSVKLDRFVVPASWQNDQPPYPGAGWQAWLWILQIEDEPIALVNLQNGEAVAPDGTEWKSWPKSFIHPAGYPFPHYGFHIVAKDHKGGLAYDKVVHVAQARRVYKNLAEELFQMSQEPAFALKDSNGAIELWNDLVGGY